MAGTVSGSAAGEAVQVAGSWSCVGYASVGPNGFWLQVWYACDTVYRTPSQMLQAIINKTPRAIFWTLVIALHYTSVHAGSYPFQEITIHSDSEDSPSGGGIFLWGDYHKSRKIVLCIEIFPFDQGRRLKDDRS
jgi:hypothetical protein